MKKISLILIMISLTLFFTGCFDIKIRRDIDYPRDLFQKAAAEINQLVKKSTGTPATNLHVLVYDGEDRQFVQCCLPISLIDGVLEASGEFEGKKFMKKHGDYLDFNWQSLRKISTLGPGLLIEVEDIENDNHVLIWMD